MSYKFQKLTPTKDIDLGIYEEAIDYAFAEDDVRNIAISGAYGAGKSSVIETYKEKNKGNVKSKKFLHISLAHFKESEDNCAKDEENTAAQLEGKILNQLIHQMDSEKIPMTDFKVKKSADSKLLRRYTLWSTGFGLLLLFIIYNNKWCKLVTGLGKQNVVTNFLASKEAVMIAGIALVVIAMKGIYTFLKLQSEKKFLKKLSIQGNEFEILADCKESYFDRYLNEVLYLFENVNADAIVFEDIDRFDKNSIFEKLREINTLLERRGKDIRFFYLLRDDIFASADRTKFFDLIIPVVPVIDGSNAFDQFIDNFKKAEIFQLFSMDFLQGISLFVDDMRILKNIQNEFMVYYDRLKKDTEGLNWDKLLAIITYKNLFPKDFSQLQLRSGYVYTLFASKSDFRRNEIERLETEEDVIRERIQNIDNEMAQQIEDLEAIYFTMAARLRVNNKEEKQFSSRLEFIKEMHKFSNRVEYYVPSTYSRSAHWADYDMQKFYDTLAKSAEYQQRKKLLEGKSESQKEKLRQNIILLEMKKQEVLAARLRELITRENKADIFAVSYVNDLNEENSFEDVKRSPYFDLIKYLVMEGYIDETYAEYMTYFYPNSLTAGDKQFLRSISVRNVQDYSYELRNPQDVVKRLKEKDFAGEETLNFDLLDCLLINSKEYAIQLQLFLRQIYESKQRTFITQYIIRGKNTRIFVREMNTRWNDMCTWILTEEDFEPIRTIFVKETLCGCSGDVILDNNQNNILKDYVEENTCVLNIFDEDIEEMWWNLQCLQVHYIKLDYENINSNLFYELYCENAYDLNTENVNTILEHIYKIKPEDINWSKNLTQILAANEEQPLKKYVIDKIDNYLPVIFQNTNVICDEEKYALYVLNHVDITFENKVEYVSRLETKITLLEEVVDTDVWPYLLHKEIVEESADNLCEYYFNSGNGLDKHLVHYINNSEADLNVEGIGFGATYGEEAEKEFLESIAICEELSDHKYREIVKSFRFFDYHFNLKGISKERVDVLILCGIISMSEETLKLMHNEYPDNMEAFISHNLRYYVELMQNEKLFNADELEILINQYDEDDNSTNRSILEIAVKNAAHIIEKQIVPRKTYIMESMLLDENISMDQRKQLLAIWMPSLTKKSSLNYLFIAGLIAFYEVCIGKRPAFEKTEANKKLLDSMVEKELISSYKEDTYRDGYYKAYGKRKRKL